MNLVTRLIEKSFSVFGNPAGQVAPVREAFGQTIDDDEAEWRPLTGESQRDLPVLTLARQRELAAYLWQTNLIANRLIELPVAYLLAEGVTLQVANPEAAKWLQAFWRDPINKMDIKLPKKVREMALFGEQCWPTFVAPNGHVRLGYLDPALIETVVTDPDNAEQPIGVVTVRNKHGVQRKYRVVVNGPENIFAPTARRIRKEIFVDGECFYYNINALSNGSRGRSDLLAQIDWLDSYETFLFGEIDRANFHRAFLWDVTLKGATPEEVVKRAKEIKVPNPGSVRVHNDAEAWEAVVPDLKQYESAAGAQLFRNHILGGGTFPTHWFGGAEDVNKASATEMGEPTFKAYSMRQREWKHIIEEVALYVINRRMDPTGRSTIDPSDPDPDLMPQANFPELTKRDTTAYASALQQVTIAAGLGLDRGLITEALALKIVQSVAERLGVEFDAETELEAARAEAAKRREADVFTDPAGVTDTQGIQEALDQVRVLREETTTRVAEIERQANDRLALREAVVKPAAAGEVVIHNHLPGGTRVVRKDIERDDAGEIKTVTETVTEQ